MWSHDHIDSLYTTSLCWYRSVYCDSPHSRLLDLNRQTNLNNQRGACMYLFIHLYRASLPSKVLRRRILTFRRQQYRIKAHIQDPLLHACFWQFPSHIHTHTRHVINTFIPHMQHAEQEHDQWEQKYEVIVARAILVPWHCISYFLSRKCLPSTRPRRPNWTNS